MAVEYYEESQVRDALAKALKQTTLALDFSPSLNVQVCELISYEIQKIRHPQNSYCIFNSDAIRDFVKTYNLDDNTKTNNLGCIDSIGHKLIYKLNSIKSFLVRNIKEKPQSTQGSERSSLKPLPDYFINIPGGKNVEFAEKLNQKFSGSSGRPLRHMIEALKEMGHLIIPSGSMEKFRDAMNDYFDWEIDTRQGIYNFDIETKYHKEKINDSIRIIQDIIKSIS